MNTGPGTSTPLLQHSTTPVLLFLFVPFEYHAVHHSAARSIILNEVKDLSSENGSWTVHLL